MEPLPRLEMSRSLCETAQTSQDMINRFFRAHAFPLMDDMGTSKAFCEMTARMLANPVKLAEAQLRLWQDYVQLWQGSMLKMWGQDPRPVAEPPAGDRRFSHEDWEDSFVFDFIKQSYLIATRAINETIASVDGMDEETRKRVAFFTRQYIDALSPSNFLLTNPEVLRATAQSGGQNLVRGLGNLLEDLERGQGNLRITMTDLDAFKLGENVATTPGKVVYQNKLMQLIQYEAATKQVFKRPLLIVPPWINKYYILDLREKNSFIKWAVDQGHTVFVISWVNPDASYADTKFEEYLTLGPIAALDAIKKAAGEEKVNAAGYCLGGTLLASTLAHMAAKKDERIASATFFASMLDFSEPGELGVFIDEGSIVSLEARMKERGYLAGNEMAQAFSMLRANDLIWSFVVNNYLLGKEPIPFDLLYWNSDSTRMPASMHGFYLRKMYLQNQLVQPGGIVLAGVWLDLSRIKTPAYFLSTIEDHISPWKSTYAGARLFSGKVKFVLAGSGHIAGVINPPVANKYKHWTNGDALPEDAAEWLKHAEQHDGSWWPDWQKWAARHGGEKVPARVPGKGKLKAIEDAPGSYVKLRLDAKAA
jgi:polyhydroxyalkanoate synthase subunit PhaC